MTTNKNRSKKLNFELFYSDPDQYFAESHEGRNYEKALFGFCVSRKSLRHALIALSYNIRLSTPLEKSFEGMNIEIKHMVLSLISNYSAPNAGTICIHELAKQNEKSEFWSSTLNDLVGMLVKTTKEADERLYTLAIRFYCNSNGLLKAKQLLEELLKSGIVPHSRTFIPLVQQCENMGELKELHNLAQKMSCAPSHEFYEAFYLTLFKVNGDYDNFMEIFGVYQKFYSYITPELSDIFTNNLKNRDDLELFEDGFVYDVKKIQAPICKLELVDISYGDKCKIAEILMNPSNISDFENVMQANRISWDIVIDGANVGLYNNSESFRYDRIYSILKWAHERNYKVLVILHGRRKDSRLESFIKKDPANFGIYYTPDHHNDDYFLLYAGLTRDSYILSNDEFRDHMNSLQPENARKFLEWRTSNQIFYSFNTRIIKGYEPFEISMPSKFSRIIQVKEREKKHLIFAPVYDITKNPSHYLENMDKIEGWIIVEP